MNELITLEINSKNKQELIDLLNTSKLVVEIMNEHNTFSVVRPDETDSPTETVHYVDIARVVNSKSEQGIAWDKQTTLKGFNYSISETT